MFGRRSLISDPKRTHTKVTDIKAIRHKLSVCLRVSEKMKTQRRWDQ